MPDLDDIVQRVAISGQDNVIEALGEIGRVGEEALRHVAESLGKVGEMAAGFAVGVAGVGAALFEWAKHSSEAVKELRNLSGQMGTTVQEASALQGALVSMGGSADGLSTAFRRAAFNIEREWEAIKKSTASARDQLISDTNAVARAQIAAQKATAKREDAFGIQTTRADTQFLPQKEAMLAESEANVALSEARRKAEDDRRNALTTTIPAVESVTKGLMTLTEAGKTAELSTENVFKSLIATSTPETANAIKNFSGNISDLAGMTPKVREFFYNLSDFMKNAHDATLEQALAVRVFGRGVGQDLIYPLKQGSDAIREHEEHLKKFGLVISNDALQPAEEFHHAYNSLTYDLSTTVKQIGLIFGPAFTEGMKGFTAFFEENHQVLLDWAHSIEQQVRPVVQGFFNALSGFFAYITGAKVDPATEVGKWKDSFESFGKTVKAVVDIVIGALSAMKEVIDKVRDAINALFGTKLNSLEVMLGGLVAWKLAGSSLGASLASGIASGVAGAGIGGGIAAAVAAQFARAFPPLIAAAIIGAVGAEVFSKLRDVARDQLKVPESEARLRAGMHQPLSGPTGAENTPPEDYDPSQPLPKPRPGSQSSRGTISIVRNGVPQQYDVGGPTSENTVRVVRGVQSQDYNVGNRGDNGSVRVVRGTEAQDYKVQSERLASTTDENTAATRENTQALSKTSSGGGGGKPFGELKPPQEAVPGRSPEVVGTRAINDIFDSFLASKLPQHSTSAEPTPGKSPEVVGTRAINSIFDSLFSSIQHFVGGGMGGGMLNNALPATSGASSFSGASPVQDEKWGIIDLRTDQGDISVKTQRDSLQSLSDSATQSRISRGAKRQTWWDGD